MSLFHRFAADVEPLSVIFGKALAVPKDNQ